ncbi:MAG: hypothetical protein QG671_4033 [Actinomycetota bacterium]|jgi:hypothetical protein|nr:hypothetical protein [Actinomycetota bacterium]HQZ86671.1 hypothetical protein [Actinomycetota bacterium]
MADGGGDQVDDPDKGLVSPDYLERKSNRNSWWIVGIFTAVIVLMFLVMGISIAMN